VRENRRRTELSADRMSPSRITREFPKVLEHLGSVVVLRISFFVQTGSPNLGFGMILLICNASWRDGGGVIYNSLAVCGSRGQIGHDEETDARN
jgi:hypothetical protein